MRPWVVDKKRGVKAEERSSSSHLHAIVARTRNFRVVILWTSRQPAAIFARECPARGPVGHSLLRAEASTTAKASSRVHQLAFGSASSRFYRALSKSPKSLMRMLSAEGNPQARNLCDMVASLQKLEGTVLEVHAATAA